MISNGQRDYSTVGNDHDYSDSPIAPTNSKKLHYFSGSRLYFVLFILELVTLVRDYS